MTRSLTRRFRDALRYAPVTIGGLAEESEYSRPSFDLYANRRPPSVKAALALADALEKRAEQLKKHARLIREAAGDAEGTAR